MTFLRRFLCGLALALVVSLVVAPPPAAAYPDKPVTLIVPFAAGGGVDLTARALSEAVKAHFTQPIAVVNKPGGGGTVGAAGVVLSRPDGYTLGIAGGSIGIQPHVVSDLPYKGPHDYQPVIRAVTVPTVLAVRSDSPWPTVKALVDAAKARPGSLRFGTSGRGTAPGLGLESFKSAAGVNVLHVPFGGSSEALTNLLGGHVEGVVVTAAEVLPHVRAGKAKVLVILEDKRVPTFTDAPTAEEAGYKLTGGLNSYLVFAPNGTPQPVLQSLHDTLKKAIESEGFRKYAQDNLYVLDLRSRTDLARDLERLHGFFGDMVKQLGLQKK